MAVSHFMPEHDDRLLDGRWRVMGVLNKGSNGNVYLARDMNFPTVSRVRVIKEIIVKDATSNSLTSLDRSFRAAIRRWNSLDYTLIPKLWDLFVERRKIDGYHGFYAVIDYVNGKDLKRIIQSVPSFLPAGIIKKWALDLCDTLHYLHQKQPEAFVFGILKPSHVIVSSDGRAQLLDFGLSKSVGMDDEEAKLYSLPESDSAIRSVSDDIYGLGATLYHAITKQIPDGANYAGMKNALEKRVSEGFSKSFADVVITALEPRSEDRFQSVADLQKAITDAED